LTELENIVVTKHPFASKVGYEILQRGGNAYDAAVAIGFVIGVVEPYMSGIGGGTLQMVYKSRFDEFGAINAPVICPSGAKPGAFKIDAEMPRGLFGFVGVENRANETGHRSVAIPGVVAGLCKIHELFCTLELTDLIKPAVEIAEIGFPLSWIDVVYFAIEYERLVSFPATAQIFLSKGNPPKPASQFPMSIADSLIQLDLANTLRIIAKDGAGAFYTGGIADALISEMSFHDHWITKDDLLLYQAINSDITSINYRDYHLVTGPDFEVFEALRILENFELQQLGHNSPEYLHLIAEACLLAHADYYHYLTASENKRMDLSNFLSNQFVQERVSEINPILAMERKLFPDENDSADTRYSDKDKFTTGYTCADQWGNVVAILQTLGFPFGSAVIIPGTGILLNDQMLGFNPEPGSMTSISPGRVRPIPGWPIIGRNNKGNGFAIQSPGGNRVLCALVQVIINMIDFGMPIDQAMAAPRIDCGSTPICRKMIIADDCIPYHSLAGLQNIGHQIKCAARSYSSPGGSPLTFAHPGGIQYDILSRKYMGANDPCVDKTILIHRSALDSL